MKSIKFGCTVLGVAVLLACKQEVAPWKARTFTEQNLSRSDVQGKLPQSLWEKIAALLASDKPVAAVHHGEGQGEGQGEGHEAKGEGSSAVQGPVPSVFAPLKVYLIEKNHGLLTHGNTAITLAAGGGTIDLRDFVLPKSGSFYFAVEFLPDKEKIDRHVYFLSKGQTRKVDGDSFGSGCDTYFDISRAFDKAMAGDGFLLNTSEGRAVSALAGTYFFAAAQDGKLYLASLNVVDSAHPALLCKP